MTRPVLTISIPTYQRASYLDILLRQLSKEVGLLADSSLVEILVSDNASFDGTKELVHLYLSRGVHLRYFCNAENIGSDLNIAQCYNEAKGRYVLIMGDDDVLVDGVLVELVSKLIEVSPTVALLNAYGYEDDFRKELPWSNKGFSVFRSPGEFLRKAGAQITLISACVIRKEIIEPLDPYPFVGQHLVQVHLVLSALLSGSVSIVSNGYVVACKRNNSSGYIYAEIFVKNLGFILDSYMSSGLSEVDVVNFENQLLKTHHPYYVWKNIWRGSLIMNLSQGYFEDRFKGRFSYMIFVKPQFFLPRPLAWIWGLTMVIVGRVLFGNDLIRGIYFFKNRFRNAFLCY